jgi:hypothetical protein
MDELLTPEVVALLDGLEDLRESDTHAYEETLSSLKDQNFDPSQDRSPTQPRERRPSANERQP